MQKETPENSKGFADIITTRHDWNDTGSMIMAATDEDVRRVLNKAERNTSPLSPEEFGILISPAATPYLEKMAELSHRFTLERFGKTISLYIPLYLSNACANACVYCGFNHANDFTRTVLTPDRIEKEFQAIKRLGNFDNLLMVSGEFPSLCGEKYFRDAIRLAHGYFNNVSLEVQPLKTEEYRRLAEAGLYGVVCFQETYNEANYRKYHPRGMKSLYHWRLNGFDRMGQAGIHKIGMGVLLGLEEWRTDVTMMAHHLRYLQKHYWKTRYSVNFPRLCPSESGYQPNYVVSDRDLAQLTFAFRIFDHDVDISYSTRENPEFRDNMMRLGVTSMSAGSRTEPGGYSSANEALEQFEVTDSRSPRAVVEAIRRNGYEPVWKDWDVCLQ
ncbi:MAG: 2-iminoacetate synthase ThiH [Muribaculaceae bacterium]|nr:2-iminoacetate synthase ThiH [Muribaculaceae bacterium]